MWTKAKRERSLLQNIQRVGLVTDKVILDCEIHLCKTVNSPHRNAGVYIAYASDNSEFLFTTVYRGACLNHRGFYDWYFNDEITTKKDLIAILNCHDARDFFYDNINEYINKDIDENDVYNLQR